MIIHEGNYVDALTRIGTVMKIWHFNHATVMSLPMHPYLTAEQQDYIIERVRNALQNEGS